MITAAQILDKAIENWRTKGWLRGRTYDYETGAACLVGGINQAYVDLQKIHPMSDRERCRAITAVAALCDPERMATRKHSQAVAVDSIVTWNDEKGRTYEEALTLAEQARAELKRDD